MNNGQVRASAMELARQLKAQPDTAAAVTLGYQTVLGRAPRRRSRSRSPASSTCRKNLMPTTAANLPLPTSCRCCLGSTNLSTCNEHSESLQPPPDASTSWHGHWLAGLGEFAPAGRFGAQNPLAAKNPHFKTKAKSVIWLFINGGPSHVDTWDYKPELAKRDGQALEGFDRFTGFFANAVGGLMKSPFEFKPHGQSGKHVSSIFPNLSKHVDKMAFIHSAHGEQQPFTGALRDELRPAANGVSVCWLMGHIRAGKRERQPARVCGDERPEGTRPA